MNTFYQVVLIRMKADGTWNNPVHSQPTGDTLDPLDWANGKFHSVLTTYWNDSDTLYVAAYIIRSDGVVIKSDMVDRRTGE